MSPVHSQTTEGMIGKEIRNRWGIEQKEWKKVVEDQGEEIKQERKKEEPGRIPMLEKKERQNARSTQLCPLHGPLQLGRRKSIDRQHDFVPMYIIIILSVVIVIRHSCTAAAARRRSRSRGLSTSGRRLSRGRF